MNTKDKEFMRHAIAVAHQGMDNGAGGPFGAIIVKNGEVIAESFNKVTSNNDPTAHAEINVIRKACQKLNSFHLDDCTLYTSCEPCPMCFGAIYWARLKAVFYGCTQEDAANIDFDDQFIYDELDKPHDQLKISFTNLLRKEAREVFRKWGQKTDRVDY